MPINEILAPYYLRIRYQTWASEHSLTLYLNGGTIERLPSGDYTHTLLQNSSNTTGSVSVMIKQLFDAVYTSRNLWTVAIGAIELWQSAPSAPNVYVDNVTMVSALETGGTVKGAAAGYLMYTGVSTDVIGVRQKWRATFFEAVDYTNPQRSSISIATSTVPIDVVWRTYTLTNRAIVTQDGYNLSITAVNFGYNRKLARAYGRRLTP